MTFLAPLFFAGLVALLGPWLLHRFNRQDPPEMSFPSTQFLEATRVPVTRQKRLRHLDLFSLRTLMLFLVCLLFAQPYCSTDQSRAGSQRNTFVVLDRSASMQTGDRWERAVAEASSSLRSARNSAQTGTDGSLNAVQLFDVTSELSALTELTTDLTPANNALRNLAPTFEQGRYGIMMQQLDALASRQELPVDVVFVTDAQRTNLPLQRRRLRTTNIDQLSIKSVAENESNLAVRANASSVDGVNVRLSAQVLMSTSNADENTSGGSRSVNLIVSAAGQNLASESLSLTANEPVTVVINDLILPTTDTKQLNVAIAADDGIDLLSIDSAIDVPVQRAEPISVGVRALGMQEPEDASLFLRTALTTDNLARLVPFTGDAASLSSDAKHWVVFVPHGSTAEVTVPESVEEFVSAGGNVLMILQPTDEGSVEPLASADYIGGVDVAHPLALGEIDWRETNLYSALNVTPEPNDRVLMRAGRGSPMMLERNLSVDSSSTTIKYGRLLILADPLDGIASDMPLQPAFVDWTSQIVSWFDASIAFPAQLDSGESVALPVNAQVLSPTGRSLRTLADSGSANRMVLQDPGVYTIVTNVAEHAVAVTVPWEESNLETLSDDYLAEWSSGELSVAELSENDEPADSEQALNQDSDESAFSAPPVSSWWRWLLPLFALFLVAESLLANRRLAVRRDGV